MLLQLVATLFNDAKANTFFVLCFEHQTLQGDKLDGKEQSCLAMCQDRYLETRSHVQEALQKRQGQGGF
jgi:hypothetical protein